MLPDALSLYTFVLINISYEYYLLLSIVSPFSESAKMKATLGSVRHKKTSTVPDIVNAC
jgi:hypothetical protein